MTRDELSAALAPMVIQVGKELTREHLENWYLLCGDLSFEDLRRGIIVTIRTYQYAGFPPIGLVRKNAGAIDAPLAIEDRAEVAWRAVRAAISRVGGYQSVQFDDPVTTATVRQLGGWERFCAAGGRDLDAWLHKEFCGAYRSLMQIGIPVEMTRPIAGLIAVSNSAGGHDFQEPIETVMTGLPPVDKKLIRGVIRDERKCVALPSSVSNLVESLGIPEPDENTKQVLEADEKRSGRRSLEETWTPESTRAASEDAIRKLNEWANR